jgi:hypothetical protein
MTAFSAAHLLAQTAATTTTPVTTTTATSSQATKVTETVIAKAALVTPETFAPILVVVIAAVTIISLMLIYKHIQSAATNWSLADALSEETPIGPVQKNLAGDPLQDKEGKVQYENVMKASSSRLIALLGSVAIMMLYIGAGLSVLYTFAAGAGVPKDTEALTTFFLYGMVLFAPYLVNKFSNIFSWMK